ncbi:MAG: GntR family transcriptional regulator [Lachnospiraceae bacterium]|nr:GntR family transcriptional regulator [Lachnospiraceae bacterium]
MLEESMKMNVDEYLPLRDVVFNTLRQAILTGDFLPGERLMEITLAKRLGVSRTPVREAIRKLELEGLVDMIPRKGAAVARITVSDLKDVLEVRCHLEEFAASIACDRITEEEKAQLTVALKAFEQAIEDKDLRLIAQRDVEFHDVIFRATKNKRLLQIINNLREQIYRYRIEYIKDFGYHETLVKEHKEILDAIFSGNKEAAEKIMRTHIYNQEIIVIKNLKKQEEEAEAAAKNE